MASLLPIIWNEFSPHWLIGSRTSVLCKLQELFSSRLPNTCVSFGIIMRPLWVSICTCSAWYLAKDQRQVIYRFMNLLLYIDIFSLIPCSVNSSQLNSLKLYTNNLCILSLVRILSGFLSLNNSQKHAFRQKTRVIMQLISLVSFLSMIALPWHLFIQCLETAQIFCPVSQLFTVAKQV